MLDLDRDTGGR